MQTSNTWWPILTHKTLACVACLCLHTAWPRGEESRFTASFYATLDAINDLSACRLVPFSAAADANNMNNALFFIFIRYIRFNSWKLTCNFSSNTISMRLYYPINRYRKKAKLFRQSVQLIERQVLSNYLRGYKGEFLIWPWGLKNKVFLSMNFTTNFGLTGNIKSCAIFNSECMLVFTACSLLFRENKVKKLIHWGPLQPATNLP